MTERAVHVDGLEKVFDVPEREPGLLAATKSLVRRKTRAVRAVDGISFEIAPGEVVGFLGPNGAGKTTTLKMLSGLLYPTGGEARVLGHVPSKRERDFLRRITLVMGNRNQLQWDLPALDSFELNRAIYRIPREDFAPLRDELIDLLDVGDLVRKPVRQLSLGERMKVEIVGALVHRPQVLFLDEPTTGLDPEVRADMWEEIARLSREEGITILLTTHYLEEADRLAARLAIVERGRVVAEGTPEGLKGELRGDAVQVELAEPGDGSVHEALARLDGVRDITVEQRTLRARADHGASAVPAVLAALEGRGIRVASVTVARPSLDDVYLRHAGRTFAEAER